LEFLCLYNCGAFVNVVDFQILTANWMGTNRTFATGDFNYDGTCKSEGLGILSLNRNKYLAPPVQTQPA
jgi:hypothetical protein